LVAEPAPLLAVFAALPFFGADLAAFPFAFSTVGKPSSLIMAMVSCSNVIADGMIAGKISFGDDRWLMMMYGVTLITMGDL
jgi:hypothetical protein